MRWMTSRLRFWHLSVLVVVVAVVEGTTGLPGWWWVPVYAATALLFGLTMFAVIDRERRPMRDRTEFTHGTDMHGHY